MEGNILLWIQENLRSEWLSPIMIFITNLGFFIWIVFSLALIINKNTRKTGIITAISIVIDLLLVNLVMKNLFGRVRPYEVVEGLINIVEKQSDKSFPSGHTSIAFSFVSVTWFYFSKKVWIPFTVLSVLIAFSRMYIGVHYPTDILGGIICGVICGIMASWIYNYIEKKTLR